MKIYEYILIAIITISILLLFKILSFFNFNSDVLNIISIIVTIIGIITGLYTYYKTKKNDRYNKTINWDELQKSTISLAKKIKKSNFSVPDVIYAINEKDGIIASLIKDYWDIEIPIVTGLLMPHNANNNKSIHCKDYELVETGKWDIYIPKFIFSFKNKKILIVHDCTVSGTYITKLKNFFSNNNFLNNNIKYLCILVSKTSIHNNNIPDYYYLECETTDYYFPWGKVL